MTTTKRHLSVSQRNLLNRCPWAYKLSRIDKVWQRPAAWLAQGSAVHTVIEAIEKSGRTMSLEDAQALFAKEYSKEIDRYTNGEPGRQPTPNFDYWSRSGPYAGEADALRRRNLGLEQVERYFRWFEKYPHIVPLRLGDGTLAIEIGFEIELDGVPVRGYVDAVMVNTETGEIFVDDAKTGNQPGDDFQLGTYKVAMQEQYGIEGIRYGVYWMGRTGKFTAPYDLEAWTTARVAEEFVTAAQAIADADFEPDPEPSKCRFCDVSYHCEFRA